MSPYRYVLRRGSPEHPVLWVMLNPSTADETNDDPIGTTKSGAPRHPLYVRADQPLEVFR